MKRRISNTCDILFVLALLLGAVCCMAQTTIRVPADVPTIQSAIDSAQNGDTILVAPGIYNESLNFKGKGITVTSGAKSFSEASDTIIDGTKTGPVVVFQTEETSTSVLNGFTIQNGQGASTQTGKLTPECGGIVVDNSSPTITNNIVTKNNGCGISIKYSASPLLEGNDIVANPDRGVVIVQAGDVKLIDNIIEKNVTDPLQDSGNPTGAGIFVASDNAQLYPLGSDSLLLQRNIVRNNQTAQSAGYAQQIGTPVKNLMISNNLFYENTSRHLGSNQIYISGPYSGTLPTLTEVNNTVYGGGEDLILYFGASTVANNVFVNTTNAGTIAAENSGLECADPEAQNAPLDIQNNDIFNTGSLVSGDCPLGSGNLALDPVFLDPGNEDFHEQAGSPTVRAGLITAPLIPTEDLDQKARVVCGTIDMGAYELRPHPPIVLTSSSNPVLGGSSLTFTARLTGNCNVPTGTVTFLDGATVIGTATLDSDGVGSFTTAFLVVGQHNVTATYPGDFNFDASASNVLTQTITGDPTSISFSLTPNPVHAFSLISLQSQVTSPYGTPTGTVEFLADESVVASAPLDRSGKATATLSTLSAGLHAMIARYTADTRFQPSTSSPVQETVIGADTSMTLTASPNPAIDTEMITFTAAVHALQGISRAPTGTVTLLDGNALLGTAQLNAGGISTFSVASLSPGQHLITAHYQGSADFNPSSSTLTESVTLIGTTVTLSATPSPANAGQIVTMTASARALLAGVTPFGTMTFRDGTSILGTSPLEDDGTATFTTSTLTIGSHSLQASLDASSSLGGSVSSIFTEVIQAYDFTLQPGRAAVSIPSGDWTVLPLTITPVGGFRGSVKLSCDDLPEHTQCIFQDGDSVSLASGAKTVKFSINTSDVYGYGNQVAESSQLSNHGLLAIVLFPGFLYLANCRRRVIGTGKSFLCILSVLGILLGMTSCAGKLPGKTVPGNYSISLVGISADGEHLQHAAPIHLSVQ